MSPDASVEPVWSPDGRELFYRDFNTGLMVAQVETEPTFSRRTPELLFSQRSYGATRGRDFDLSPTGERFIVPNYGTAAQTSDEPFNGLIFVEHWFEELTARVPLP